MFSDGVYLFWEDVIYYRIIIGCILNAPRKVVHSPLTIFAQSYLIVDYHSHLNVHGIFGDLGETVSELKFSNVIFNFISRRL